MEFRDISMQFCATVAADLPSIEALLDRCFGPDRHKRTAYQLRHDAAPISGPTMVMREHGQIVATVQYWPVVLDGACGHRFNLTLLGPIGVAPELRGRGFGVALMKHSLSVADTQNCGPIVLIGDVEYYGRFGFSAAHTKRWCLPGPVEQHRVLLRNLNQIELPLDANLVASIDTYIARPKV